MDQSKLERWVLASEAYGPRLVCKMRPRLSFCMLRIAAAARGASHSTSPSKTMVDHWNEDAHSSTVVVDHYLAG